MPYMNDRYAKQAYQQNLAWNQEQFQNTVNAYDRRLSDYQSGANNITALMNERYHKGMGYLEGLGRSERQDMNDLYAQRLDSALGMSMTRDPGALASIQRGFASDQDKSRMRLSDMLNQRKLSTDMALSGDIAAWSREYLGNVTNLQGDKARFMGSWRPVDAMSQYVPLSNAQGGMGGGGGASPIRSTPHKPQFMSMMPTQQYGTPGYGMEVERARNPGYQRAIMAGNQNIAERYMQELSPVQSAGAGFAGGFGGGGYGGAAGAAMGAIGGIAGGGGGYSSWSQQPQTVEWDQPSWDSWWGGGGDGD